MEQERSRGDTAMCSDGRRAMDAKGGDVAMGDAGDISSSRVTTP